VLQQDERIFYMIFKSCSNQPALEFERLFIADPFDLQDKTFFFSPLIRKQLQVPFSNNYFYFNTIFLRVLTG
jgi:hypothetical protein